jgi:hypothetical protein
VTFLRLNIASLREANSSVTDSSVGHTSVEPVHVSRRAFIEAAALTPIGMCALGDGISWNREQRRIGFLLNGHERWAVDCATFSGAPKLLVTENPHGVEVCLENARFPGTEWPADFQLVLRRTQRTWWLRIRHQLFVSEREVEFIPWLSGYRELSDDLRLKTVGLNFHDCISLDVRDARMTMIPNGTFRLSGAIAANLINLRKCISSSFADISLSGTCFDKSNSLFESPARRQTTVSIPSLNSSDQIWPMFSPHFGEFDQRGPEFTALTIEFSELFDGTVNAGVRLDGTSKPPLHFRTGNIFRNEDGNDLGILLRNPRYAEIHTAAGIQDRAFVADALIDEQWCNGFGGNYLLGSKNRAGLFEIAGASEVPRLTRCILPMLAHHFPFEEMIHEAVSLGATATLALMGGETETQKHDAHSVTVKVEEDKECAHISLPPKTVIRSDDLLVLTFEYRNLELLVKKPSKEHKQYRARLVRINPNVDAFIIVHHSPQHIAEEYFRGDAAEDCKTPLDKFKPSNRYPTPDSPAQARLSGPSQVAFRVNISEATSWDNGIPYSLNALLERCSNYRMRVPTVADYPRPLSTDPIPATYPSVGVLDGVTLIEFPFRLFLSPYSRARWRHHVDPFAKWSGACNTLPTCCSKAKHLKRVSWVELWHTRLIGDGVHDNTVRAINARTHSGPGFETLPSEYDRSELIQLTSRSLNPADVRGDLERAIDVRSLMLSSLGTRSRLRYATKKPTGHSLIEWKQDTNWGRDQFVSITHLYQFAPYRHEVEFIQIAERVIATDQPGRPAYLRTKCFLKVRTPTIVYSDPVHHVRNNAREIFRSVTLLNAEAIEISLEPIDGFAGDIHEAFWPIVQGQPLYFDADVEDHAGIKHRTRITGIAVRIDKSTDPNFLATVAKAYRGTESRSEVAIGVRPYAFAPQSAEADRGDSAIETIGVTIEGIIANVAGAGYLYPVFEQARIRLAALELITKREFIVSARYNAIYADRSFSAGNEGELLLDLVNAARVDWGNGTEKVGGLTAPNLWVVALSRLTGVVGGLPDWSQSERDDALSRFASGVFEPSVHFDDASLLGMYEASEHLARIDNFHQPANRERVLRLISRRDSDGQLLHSGLKWVPRFKNNSTLSGSTLDVDVTRTPAGGSGGTPNDRAHAAFRDLVVRRPTGRRGHDLQFSFDSLVFEQTGRSDQKLSVSPSQRDAIAINSNLPKGDDHGVGFLADFFKLFNPLGADIVIRKTQFGIEIRIIAVNIPHLKIWSLFELRNLKVQLVTFLPLTAQHPWHQAFMISEPAKPFVVTFGPFSGSGFLVVQQTGICVATLEVGLNLSAKLSFSVAKVFSASVSGSLSIYLFMAGDAIQFDGTLSANGSADVLGLVSVSISFVMELHYKSLDSIYGHVQITVEIHLFFLKKSVNLNFDWSSPLRPGRVVRNWRLATTKDTSQSSFEEVMSKRDWRRYCLAFA